MSEEIKMPNPPEPMEQPEKKNRTVLWIILAVVAVLVLCLCVIVVAAVIIFAASSGDWGSLGYYFIPGLLGLA